MQERIAADLVAVAYKAAAAVAIAANRNSFAAFAAEEVALACFHPFAVAAAADQDIPDSAGYWDDNVKGLCPCFYLSLAYKDHFCGHRIDPSIDRATCHGCTNLSCCHDNSDHHCHDVSENWIANMNVSHRRCADCSLLDGASR